VCVCVVCVLKTDERRCANGKLRAGKYRTQLHRSVAVREQLARLNSRYSQLTLPGQQAVLPPFYCGYLRYFSIDSVQLQSTHILTSSHGTDGTADVIHTGIKSRNGDG